MVGLSALAAERPLALHPANPHYFLFRGRPTILLTSGEHYGAVLNAGFDYVRYLDTLQRSGLNLTRTFVGSYWELSGDKPSFNIAGNTLAPPKDKFLAAWDRSGDRWNLAKFNNALFARLTDFVREAGKRGIVVEVNLFTPMYDDALWEINPMNGFGPLPRTDVFALKNERLTAVQTALVRQVVTILRNYDNVYYEVMNEPYFGGVTMEWHRLIARTIADTEAKLGVCHLISWNVANGSKKIEDPDPLISIFNFHYSRPPESVALNYGLNRVIGNNETGFDGISDATYRVQAWDFLIAGGGLFNNLDYSFTVGHEDGTFQVPAGQPGGGSPALRRQYRVLGEFLNGLDFIHMRPMPEIVKKVTPAASSRVLGEAGKAYAVYIHATGGGERELTLALDLPAGRYEAAWLDPKTGATLKRERLRHGGGEREFLSPADSEDLALRIRSSN